MAVRTLLAARGPGFGSAAPYKNPSTVPSTAWQWVPAPVLGAEGGWWRQVKPRSLMASQLSQTGEFWVQWEALSQKSKTTVEASRMAWRVKTLVSMPNDLSSSSTTWKEITCPLTFPCCAAHMLNNKSINVILKMSEVKSNQGRYWRSVSGARVHTQSVRHWVWFSNAPRAGSLCCDTVS